MYRYVEKQRVWEWLALGNFLMGGAGGGVYAVSYPLSLYVEIAGFTWLELAAALLVVAGLLCVMAEAGRPLRAMGVIRNLKTSWMSREALFASGFVLFSLIDVLLAQHYALRLLAWFSAVGYVVSQSFMLAAAKKIPAWNTPATSPFFITLSIAAGAGVVSIASQQTTLLTYIDTILALATLLIGASYIAWPGATTYFRQAILRENNYLFLAVSLVITAIATAFATLGATYVAGVLLIAGTSLAKYTVIIRMSYKLPVLPPIEA